MCVVYNIREISCFLEHITGPIINQLVHVQCTYILLIKENWRYQQAVNSTKDSRWETSCYDPYNPATDATSDLPSDRNRCKVHYSNLLDRHLSMVCGFVKLTAQN